MLIEKVLIGFVVGTLIGMTGVGGGVLLLPLLIFVLKIPPIIAVGSDALFNFVTKIGSSGVHLSKGTVRRKVVLALATGSIPGSILGVSFLGHLRTVYGTGVNTFITTVAANEGINAGGGNPNSVGVSVPVLNAPLPEPGKGPIAGK